MADYADYELTIDDDNRIALWHHGCAFPHVRSYFHDAEGLPTLTQLTTDADDHEQRHRQRHGTDGSEP